MSAIDFAHAQARKMNDPHGDGSGRDAVPPTGDDWNELFSVVTQRPRPNLDELLERWQVHDPSMWENATGPKGWFAVSDDDGIKAYFAEVEAAFRWRLDMINRELNP